MKRSEIKIQDYMNFRTLELPDQFFERPRDIAYGSTRWVRDFVHADIDAMRIAVFYRGGVISALATEHFRDVLSKVPMTLLNEDIGVVETALLQNLSDAMGNLGENQISEPADPAFFLKRCEVRYLNRVPVIDSQGYFDTAKGLNFCHVIQFDGDPTLDLAEVHEIMFQAPGYERYCEYHPAFEEFLNSIEWQF